MENPKSFLQRCLGSVVVVTLKDDRRLRGKLSGYDEFINLTLEDAVDPAPPQERKLGQVVVRGSQVIAIHLPKSPSGGGAPV